MGRKKIKLKRIECIIQRRSKYSKRKKGILKKAHEMATLCDVDVVLILISPTKKPTLFHSRSRPLGSILEKFLAMSLQEREDRRAYTNKTLKKLLDINKTGIPSKNDDVSSERDEVLQDDKKIIKLRDAEESLAEKKSILREWENPYEVDDLDRLNIMEKYLVSTLSQTIHLLKLKEDKRDSGYNEYCQSGIPISGMEGYSGEATTASSNSENMEATSKNSSMDSFSTGDPFFPVKCHCGSEVKFMESNKQENLGQFFIRCAFSQDDGHLSIGIENGMFDEIEALKSVV